MTLYFRLIRLILRVWFKQPDDAFKTYSLKYRALPFDCDLNKHITNSKYYAFMDLGRIQLMAGAGFLQKSIKKGWYPVLSATHMTFIRPIDLMQSFELKTRILCWDAKYCYFEHRFEVNNKLHAIGLCRGACIYKRQPVAPDKIFLLSQKQLPSSPTVKTVDVWQQLLEQQKKALMNHE